MVIKVNIYMCTLSTVNYVVHILLNLNAATEFAEIVRWMGINLSNIYNLSGNLV